MLPPRVQSWKQNAKATSADSKPWKAFGALKRSGEGLAQRLDRVQAPAREIAAAIASLTTDSENALGNETAPLTDLATAVGELMTAARRIDSVRLAPLIEALDRRFEDASALYYQLRQQEQAVNESLKQQRV